MSAITTHVLDSTSGRPVEGVPVRLERADGRVLATARTDADGRARELGPGRAEPGVYRLVLDTDGPFYPEVVVSFRLTEPTAHCHVPVLLGHYAYTTYRGS